MSDDFIREVDEELRRDQVMQLWKKHSNWIIGAAVLVVAAVAGYNFWVHRQTQAMHAASTQYDSALSLFQQDKRKEAEARLGVLALEPPEGYPLLARFRLAASQGAQDPEAGAKAYEELAKVAGIDPVWRDLAILRASALKLDGKEAEAAAASLETLAGTDGVWRHSARDLLFAYAIGKNDYATAGRWLDKMSADSATPTDLRQRLSYYSSVVAGGAVQPAQ